MHQSTSPGEGPEVMYHVRDQCIKALLRDEMTSGSVWQRRCNECFWKSNIHLIAFERLHFHFHFSMDDWVTCSYYKEQSVLRFRKDFYSLWESARYYNLHSDSRFIIALVVFHEQQWTTLKKIYPTCLKTFMCIALTGYVLWDSPIDAPCFWDLHSRYSLVSSGALFRSTSAL